MDSDRHGFPAGSRGEKIQPQNEASDLRNTFLISVHLRESAVQFAILGRIKRSPWRIDREVSMR